MCACVHNNFTLYYTVFGRNFKNKTSRCICGDPNSYGVYFTYTTRFTILRKYHTWYCTGNGIFFLLSHVRPHLGLSGILQSGLYVLRAIRGDSRLYTSIIEFVEKKKQHLTVDVRRRMSYCTRYAKKQQHTTCLILLRLVLLPFTRAMPHV